MKPENDCSNFDAMPEFSRRAFIGSLIASAVVAGVPLPDMIVFRKPQSVGKTEFLFPPPDHYWERLMTRNEARGLLNRPPWSASAVAMRAEHEAIANRLPAIIDPLK